MMYAFLVATFGDSIQTPDAAPPSDFSTGEFYGSMIQVVVVLAVVVGLIVVLIRFLAGRNKRWSGKRSLLVHAGVPLGPNKSLQIVEIGDAVYVVGVGENVTLLDKIDDPEKTEALLAALDPSPAPTAGGAITALTQWIASRRKRPPSEETEWQANEAFRDLLSQKLKGIQRKEAMKEWMEEEER